MLPTTIPLGDAGALEVTEPFQPDPGTRGRLACSRSSPAAPAYGARTRVEIALSAWAGRASELVVRPVSRSPHHWGQRRLGRYRRLAPLLADEIVRRRARRSPCRAPPASPRRAADRRVTPNEKEVA